MPEDNRAIFEVVARVNDTEIDQFFTRMLARLEQLDRAVAAGTITPGTARSELVGMAATAQASQQILQRQGADPNTLRRFTQLIEAVGEEFTELRADGQHLSTSIREFDRQVASAAKRITGTAEKTDPFATRLDTISRRADVANRLVDDPVARAARQSDAEAKRRLREDDRRQEREARQAFASEIFENDRLNARLKAQENAALQQALQGDVAYLGATAEAAIARKRLSAAINANVTETLAADGAYVRNTADIAIARRRIGLDVANRVERDAARSPFDAIIAGENAALRQSRQVRENLAAEGFLAADRNLARQTGELAAIRQRRKLREQAAFLQASAGDVDALGQAEASDRRRKTQVALVAEQTIAADRLLIRQTAELAAVRRRNAVAEREAYLSATRSDLGREARLAAEEASRRIRTEAEGVRQIQTDPVAAARNQLDIADAARIQAQKIRDDAQREAEATARNIPYEAEITENLALTAAAEQRRALAVQRQVREKLGTAFIEEQAAEDVAQAAAAESRRLSVVRRTLQNDEQMLSLKAQSLVQNKLLVQAERRLAQETLRQAVRLGQVERGTLFQRFQAGIAARSGGEVRLPTDYSTLGQTARGSLLTSARFAFSGALLYGGVQAISSMIREASELERIFNQIRRQFESLGQGQNFQGFRTEILAIARETGAAASQVAFVGFQLQGAFGGNTQRALRETEAAFRAVRVTGLEINEVIDAFTALTENFNRSAVSIEQVSDTALGLQERFGVLANQTISFAADLAPVAAQAGFTVQQLEALGAVAQKYSGRTGAGLAEAFGRILPSIQQNAVQFLQLFNQLGDQGLSDQIAAAFREGNIAEFFELLLRNYARLSQAQRNQVIDLLGGRREAQALIPVLENAGELITEFARGTEDAGKTNAYFADLQQTLNQQLAEFGERLSQLGVKLFESGIKDFLEDLIGLAGQLISVLGGLADILTTVGGAIGSVPGVGGGLSAVLEAFLLYRGVAGVGRFASNRFFGRAAAGTAAGAGQIPGQLALFGATAGGATGFRATAAAARTAALAGGATTGRATVAGLSAGLRQSLTGFNWVALGATVGLLVSNEISAGAEEAARRNIANIIGPDLRIQEGTETRRLLGEAGIRDTYQGYRNRASQYGDPYQPGSARTLNELRDAMIREAERGASDYQQGIDVFLPGNFSANLNERRDAAIALFEEYEVNRPLELLQTLLADDAVLAEIIRQQLPELDEDPEGTAEELQKRREAINDLMSDIAAGTANPERVSRFLANYFGDERDGGWVGQAMRGLEVRARQEERAASDIAGRIMAADEAIRLFEAGDIGLAEVRAALRESIAARREIDSTAPEDQAALANEIRRERELQGEALLRQAEALVQSGELRGAGPQETLDIYLNLLEGNQLSPEQEQDAAQRALEALKEVHQARVDMADSAAEQARILAEGTAIPTELRIELIEQYLNTSVQFTDALFDITAGSRDLIRDITERVAEIYATTGQTLEASLSEAVNIQIAVLQARRAALANLSRILLTGGIFTIPLALAHLVEIGKIDAQLNTLRNATIPGDVGKAPAFDRITGTAEEVRQATEEGIEEAYNIRIAQLELQKALVEGDPVAEANLDAAIAQEQAALARAQGDRAAELQAQAALVRAGRAREQAFSEIRTAQSDLNLALRGDDPIGSAFDQLVQANEALALARGAAERLQAQAAQVRAQRSLAEAFQDVGLAQLELAQAFADASGDSVEAARIALQIANQQLANIRQNSPNDQAAILRAQADAVSAQAGLRDADLAERQRAIDVALQLERITVGQAIAQLQALLQIPNLTKEQTDNLLLKIKQLQDDLGQDFRFNLPTQIMLPTAYEVRRLGQAGSATAYNDNRQVSVTVYAETNASAEAIGDAVAQVVGEPTRFGTTNRRY